jgi:hypothetical protein
MKKKLLEQETLLTKKRKAENVAQLELAWQCVSDESNIEPDSLMRLRQYQSDLGITVSALLPFCQPNQLQFIAACLKRIPRNAFCDAMAIRYSEHSSLLQEA